MTIIKSEHFPAARGNVNSSVKTGLVALIAPNTETWLFDDGGDDGNAWPDVPRITVTKPEALMRDDKTCEVPA